MTNICRQYMQHSRPNVQEYMQVHISKPFNVRFVCTIHTVNMI